MLIRGTLNEFSTFIKLSCFYALGLMLIGCKPVQRIDTNKTQAAIVSPNKTYLVITFQFYNDDGTDAGDYAATFTNKNFPFYFLKGQKIEYQDANILYSGIIGDVKQSTLLFEPSDEWSQDLIVDVHQTKKIAVPAEFQFDEPTNLTGPINVTYPNHIEHDIVLIFQDVSGAVVHQFAKKFIDETPPYLLNLGDTVKNVKSGIEYVGIVSDMKHEIAGNIKKRTWQQRTKIMITDTVSSSVQ